MPPDTWWSRYRWWSVGLVLAVLTLAVAVIVVEPDGERARADGQRTMLVVGDSISADYNHVPGSPLQGWWSLVARELGYDPTVLAESGSGYQRPGAACTGTTFAGRPGVFDQPAPDLVLVEGGRNDWARCDGTNLVEVDPEVVQRAADDFLARLDRAYPDARVVVLAPPWGPLQRRYAEPVTEAVAQAAERQGFEFVRLEGVLPDERTPDGVHPNLAGSQAIAEVVLRALS